MSNPFISILMAVYNGERFLRKTIDSILNQTYKEFEFIIIDDGSSDKTLDIIKSYKDKRIFVHTNNVNIGQTKSLNIGLNLARGEYIARIDAGDVSLPNRLERQIEIIKSDPNISVLGTSAFRYNEYWKIIDVVHMPVSHNSILLRLLFTSPIIHISVLMKRDVILNLGGYDENFYVLADYDLWSRLLFNNYHIKNIKDILVGYMVSLKSFGSINAYSKSFIEASKIIQKNVKNFANITISLDEAANIRKFFDFSIQELSLEETITTEKLINNIIKKMGIPKKEIDYLLVRKYIKYLANNIKNPEDKLKLKFVIKSIFAKIDCLFSSYTICDDISKLIHSFFWKFKKSLFF